jgi:hypothetical protein
MFDDLKGQVHVQIGPVKVRAVRQFDMADLLHRGLLEPGEMP